MAKHIHAEAMMRYAEDMAKDSTITWQAKAANSIGDWVDIEGRTPHWDKDAIYRRKPETIITVNNLSGIYLGSQDNSSEFYFRIEWLDNMPKKVSTWYHYITSDVYNDKLVHHRIKVPEEC